VFHSVLELKSKPLPVWNEERLLEKIDGGVRVSNRRLGDSTA
jgi:hypothetical protein